MIKVDKNNSSFEGTLAEFATETAIILKDLKKICVENLGEENGNKFYDITIKVASMSKEEIDEEAKKIRMNSLFKILGIEV